MPHVPVCPHADMRQLCQYMFHVNSLQWTVWLGTLVYIHFTLLPYAPEQICQPYCTYMSYCMSTIVNIHINQTSLHILVKEQLSAALIYHTIAISVSEMNVPLKYHIYTTCPNYSMSINGRSIPNLYDAYKPIGIKHVTKSSVHRWQHCSWWH